MLLNTYIDPCEPKCYCLPRALMKRAEPILHRYHIAFTPEQDEVLVNLMLFNIVLVSWNPCQVNF